MRASNRILSSVCTTALVLTLGTCLALAQGGGGGGAGGGGAGGGSGGASSGGAGGTTSGGARSGGALRGGSPGTTGVPGTGGSTLGTTPSTGNRASPNSVPVPRAPISPNPALGTQTDRDSPSEGRMPQGDLTNPGDQATDRNDVSPNQSGTRSGTPNSPIDQPQIGQQVPSSSGGSSRRGGARGRDMQECMDTWDAGTHMSKSEWRRTCSNTLRNRPELHR